MSTRVTVQGIGMHTALGDDEITTLLALRSGLSAFSEHPRWVDQYGEHMVMAHIGKMDAFLPLRQRLHILALDSALKALSNISQDWLKKYNHQLRIYLALPSPQAGISAAMLTQVAENLANSLMDVGWPIEGIVPLTDDQAGGLIAIEQAMQYLQHSGAPFCLAGGVDSWIGIERLEWLDAINLLHSMHQPWGFIPGEACSFCLLARITPSDQEINPSSEVLAVSHAHDAFRPYTEDTPSGDTLSRICQNVLSRLPEQMRIEDIHADLNGERWRATEWGMASLRLAPWLVRIDQFNEIASGLGDIGAATGSVLLGLALAAAKKGYAEGDHALLWTANANGLRAAMSLYLPLQQAWLRDIA